MFSDSNLQPSAIPQWITGGVFETISNIYDGMFLAGNYFQNSSILHVSQKTVNNDTLNSNKILLMFSSIFSKKV